MATSAPNKHLAFLLPRFNAGGAERVMVDYANLLVAANYRVTFIVGVAKGPYQQFLTNKVAVVSLEQSRILLAVPALIQALKKHRIDLLISTLLNANLAAILATKFWPSRTKVIIREATTPSKAIAYGKRKFLYRLARQLFPRADRIIAVSEGVAADLMDFYKLPRKQIRVIYNPNNIQYTDTIPDHHFFQATYQVILGVGRFVPVKNFPLLLEAFAKVQAQAPNTRLLIIGKQGLNSTEEARIQRKLRQSDLADVVDLLDFQTNIAAYLSHAQLYVLSSDYEGLPNVLIQALACGTPVVSTNCCAGVGEILDNGTYGTIVPPKDPDALAKAILQQLHSPIPSRSARQSRATFFSPERCQQQMIQLIEEV